VFAISQQTFSDFERGSEDEYVRRLADHLRQTVPGMASEPPAQLHEQIRQLKAQAKTYDMVSEQAVAAFVVTAAHLGLDFVERFRAPRQILFSPRSQEKKAELLKAFTVQLLDTLARPL